MQHIPNKHKGIFPRALPSVLVIALAALLILSPSVSFKYMSSAMKLCAMSLIPSLFPFMVISDILISSNAKKLLSVICAPIRLLFGTSKDGSLCVLMGFLCGFPIGARSALKLYGEGRISLSELHHIMCFCNIPSPAFVCGTLGVIFGSVTLGRLLFVSLLLSSVIIGLVGRRFYKYSEISSHALKEADVMNVLSPSVANSCTAMLCVCGYVLFFSVIFGYIREACVSLGAPSIVPTVISGVLEIFGGMSCAAEHGGVVSIALAGFFAGFSGLSVFFQIISLDSLGVIRRGHFFIQKMIQGVLCGGMLLVLTNFFEIETRSAEQTVGRFYDGYGVYTCILFFSAAALTLFSAKRRIARKESR